VGALTYRARSLLTWQRERSSSLRLSGGGDGDGGGGGSVGPSFGEIQTKTRAPRDYVNAGAAELYRSRMLILARLSVRFSGLIVCVCECERAGAALRWVGGPVRAPHFRAEDAPAVFVKHNERRAGKFRHSASVPRPMMRCATLFGHVQG
jgi:hypothetical protein